MKHGAEYFTSAIAVLGSHASFAEVVALLGGRGIATDIKTCATYVERSKVPAFPKLDDAIDTKTTLYINGIEGVVNKDAVSELFSK